MQSLYIYNVYAESDNIGDDKLIEEQAKSEEAKSIENQMQNYANNGIKELLPEYDPNGFITNAAKGKFNLNIKSILNGVLRYFFKEIYINIGILIKLIVLIVLCAILKNLQSSFLSASVGELAFFVCYIVIVSVLIVSLNSVLTMGRGIIDDMVDFMQASIPILITLLISSGNITSGGIFQPLLVVIVEIVATIMKNIFIPIILLSTILSLVNNISDKVQISKLASFLKQTGTVILGLILTVFIAIITIQGSVGAVVDGVSSKTAKFAIGAFIPVAGKYLADAADTVLGCTLLIKNASGIAVMIGIVSICLVPIIKIFALISLYKMTAVLVEPIAENRIVKCINDVAGSLTFVLGVVACVAFMFLIAITAIIASSSISSAIR
ncbi:stage III sporulation protein AE [Pseudobacteroides cellulosolvens ATCC 35603 = DSM 2933]|uniref:Stage III sporulation protein AE n=2 Tax=Pseudobacteroides cellulosolvens TaxID=35825 RepID=A0A0L6JLS8_9FIRM|nr:stage III sporulation protein AE [Pseudobacteroides cellulosolvens ATCC 35603 = DSM 2933]